MWGGMASSAWVVNPRSLRRLPIGAQVTNLPYILQIDLRPPGSLSLR
jgi:hypothetical protein